MYRKRIVCGIVVLIVLIGSIIYLRVSEARGWNKHDDILTEDNSKILTPTEMPIGDGAMLILPSESHFGDNILFLGFQCS
ncbi:hypothetical protein [Lachnoclostridium phytofermentans]|uniref:Uncharacterized protein n=1 Tax=Lachnoclostridium phytofermentans (strain ATCC 700394 / DSM 18823 / ISDg) TaxID=357809 RepID=A9KMK0_LACP7|nr:hypothetical protein [Lachnoclostridium phytofermentans]ABX41445.1 hypothetical protein Cphy_1065 [Lachnoclostridium phytofermentans ISDg]